MENFIPKKCRYSNNIKILQYYNTYYIKSLFINQNNFKRITDKFKNSMNNPAFLNLGIVNPKQRSQQHIKNMYINVYEIHI